MYEYKVRRYTAKRSKGGKKTLNPMSATERAYEKLINNEAQDGWEFFFKDNRMFYFRKLKK